MVAVPIMYGAAADQTASIALAGLLTFLGGPGHVSLTTWFYLDPVAREYFFAHRLRYFFAPALLIVGTTLAYVIWQEQAPTRWINFFFTVWLLWHYQRQNWGIHSFVTRVTSAESASKLEDLILKTAVVGGVIGGIKSAGFGGGTRIQHWAPAAFQLGSLITMTLPLLIVAAVVTVPGLRRSPLRIATLVVGAGFFLPVFLANDLRGAIVPYALAHGLQYMVFMTYVSQAAGRASPSPGSSARPGLWAMGGGLLVVGYLLSTSGEYDRMREWNLLPLFGLSLGVTMAHFVIDAGIWRLRDEFPRRYIGAAFPFLFSGSPVDREVRG
jgi:hypothetical protein